MAKKVWRGDAPDVPQIDVVEFDGDPVIAEGSDLIFAINDKQIVVEAPDAVTDLAPEVAGDTYGVRDLLNAAAAAINGSQIPEFAEIEAAVETPDSSEEAPYQRLTLTSREPGRPFTIAVTAPHPTIDIDVLQVGGPGLNERQSFRFLSPPSGGSYQIAWDLGSGVETSTLINYAADAAAVKAALVAGMASLTNADVSVSGNGTSASPFVIELGGSLAETNVPALTVDTSALTSAIAGQVNVTTLQNGAITGGDSDAIQYLTNYAATHTGLLTHDTIKLKFDGQLTAAIDVGVGSTESAASVQSKLEALSTIGAGNIQVSGGGFNAASRHFMYVFKFIGALAETSQPTIKACNATTNAEICNTNILQNGGQAFNNETYLFATDHTSGAFTLTFDGETTANIALSGGILQDGALWNALVALPNIAINDVTQFAGVAGTSDAQSKVGGIVWNTFGTYYQQDTPDVTFTNVSLTGGTFATWTKITDGGPANPVYGYETQAVYTNGSGGTFTLTRPDPNGGTTGPLSPLMQPADLQTQLEVVYGAGNVSVTGGTGVLGDPWIVEFVGALSGQDLPQLTGNGANLTGSVSASVSTLQHGSPPLPQQWSVVLHGATGGNWTLEFLGRVTASLAHNANAAAVEAALVAIEPGEFTGLFDVTGAGSFADPFLIEVAGRLAGTAQSLIARNEALTGTGQTLNQYTRQSATGRRWWDNPANWRDFDTGEPGIPDEDDDVWVQTGDDSNSILYGLLQSAVKLNSFVKSSLFSGSIGLPLRTETGYVEYRPRHLAIGFAADGDQSILIGNDRGQGSGRINLDTGTDEVHLRVERTDGPLEPGFQSLNWRGNNAANTLTLIEGFVGIAAFAFETAELEQIVQRGGVLQLGPGTAVASGGLDKTSGDLYSDGATIGGVPLIIRG